MNQQELVEAVIKEVRRVLALRGVQISPSPEASPSATPSPAAPPRMAPAPVYSGGAYGADTDLTGKQVIVLKDIQSVSGGSVRVARNAVITPMAIDYAREKGITLERVETPEKKEASGSVPSTLVGLTVKSDFQGNAAMVKNFLSAHGIQVREFTGQSYETAVQNLSSGVASGAVHFGLCLENSGMLGPIQANRNQAIRAVHCRDLYEARAARVDIGANVLVIDANSNPEAIISGFTGIE